ncbi:MAG: MoaD/ThiS family protein [Candidatus Korobacteraceae bacterium]|jgi:molybdopterin converting factor small subunit
MVRIRFTTFLGERIGGISSVEVSATTVGSALRALTDRYPELARLVWTGEDVINPMMAVFLNDQLVEAGQLGTSVKTGDEIDLLAAVSGGVA